MLLTAAGVHAADPAPATSPAPTPPALGRHPELDNDTGPVSPIPNAAAGTSAVGGWDTTGWQNSRPPGPIPGGAILPNGRSVLPVGAPIQVGILPLGMTLSPNGRWLAVLNDGRYGESISVVDTRTDRVVSTTAVDMAFIGIVFSSDGRKLWAAGGGNNSVLQFQMDPDTGSLKAGDPIPVAGYPTGLALSRDGSRLFCTQNYANHVSVIDTATSSVVASYATGHMPYGVAAGDAGVWVTNWADGTLQQLSSTGQIINSLAIGKLAGPVMVSPGGGFLYACSTNEDRMVAVNLAGAGGPRVSATTSFAPYRGAPVGSVPSALALNPATGTVYVALAGLNAVAEVDGASLSVTGLIPTGWYPSALAVSPDGAHLYAAAAKGLGTGPNAASGKSIALLTTGYVYDIPLRGAGSLETERAAWKQQALTANGLLGGSATAAAAGAAAAGSPVRLPPIKHVVYVIKENRTYDQVLGDLGRGNGDPKIAFYGRKITPNTHALADRFAIGDNFYSDGEVSVQGHQWTLGANSPDYVERTWPQVYAGHARIDDSTETPVTYPAGGYLMRACAERGISSRMYGDRVMRDDSGHPLPGLKERICPAFRGWDTRYPDTKREAAWEDEFKKGIFPQYSYVWFPDDHTAGTRVGFRTPQAMVASNDLALGRLVSAISHSKYWKDTAIFVTEDDSQDGLDHVDAHRNLLLVISPWSRSGFITHSHYSQVSISHTIDLLLGVPPLSQFDAGAPPITDVWTDKPDMRPFDPAPETVDVEAQNTVASLMHRESEALDLSEADTSTDGLLERILLADARGVVTPAAGPDPDDETKAPGATRERE